MDIEKKISNNGIKIYGIFDIVNLIYGKNSKEILYGGKLGSETLIEENPLFTPTPIKNKVPEVLSQPKQTFKSDIEYIEEYIKLNLNNENLIKTEININSILTECLDKNIIVFFIKVPSYVIQGEFNYDMIIINNLINSLDYFSSIHANSLNKFENIKSNYLDDNEAFKVFCNESQNRDKFLDDNKIFNFFKKIIDEHYKITNKNISLQCIHDKYEIVNKPVKCFSEIINILFDEKFKQLTDDCIVRNKIHDLFCEKINNIKY
jgi:hypothetical protein